MTVSSSTPRQRDTTTARRFRRPLALALVAGLLVTVAACSDADDAGDAGDGDAPSVAEFEAALERAEAAEAERDALAEQLDELGEVDADALAAVEAELAAAEEELTAAQDELALAQVQLEATTARADTAEARVAEIEEIAGQFPISLDSSLIPDDMPGAYRINFTEAYCEGFSNCGSSRPTTTATIYFTPERFLRIGVDGVLDAGLFALDGSLYGITDSVTAIPPCGDVQRRARITITLYAGSISVLEDGTRVVNDLNASLTVDAPAEEGCPSGLVFFASDLTPV
jgi:hypothetical protein